MLSLSKHGAGFFNGLIVAPASRRCTAKVGTEQRARPIDGGETMANQLGKRYLCEACGTEVLCNKPGTGAVSCCDQDMKLKEAKPLPSSD